MLPRIGPCSGFSGVPLKKELFEGFSEEIKGRALMSRMRICLIRLQDLCSARPGVLGWLIFKEFPRKKALINPESGFCA